MAAAKSRGAKAVSGLGMLVYQAAESFKLWTGKDADTSAMLAAARAALGSVAATRVGAASASAILPR